MLRDVVLDHVIRHDLAEAQQAVVFVEREKMGEETLAVARGQLANENRRTTGVRAAAIAAATIGAAERLMDMFTMVFSLIRHATCCIAKRILADYGESGYGKTLKTTLRATF